MFGIWFGVFSKKNVEVFVKEIIGKFVDNSEDISNLKEDISNLKEEFAILKKNQDSYSNYAETTCNQNKVIEKSVTEELNKFSQLLNLYKNNNDELKKTNSELYEKVILLEKTLQKLEKEKSLDVRKKLPTENINKDFYFEKNKNQNIDTIEKTKHSWVVFSDDFQFNKRKIDSFIKKGEQLRDDIRSLESDGTIEIYYKIVDMLLSKLSMFRDKLLPNTSSSKFAKVFCSILSQTLVKGLQNSRISPFFENYLIQCGVKKENYSIGQKIKNDDYDYIEEPLLTVPVNNKDQNETIKKIIRNAYSVHYKEDGNDEFYVLPGIFEIGQYSE